MVSDEAAERLDEFLPHHEIAPVVGAKTTTDRITSGDITNQYLQLAACPSLREKCGKRIIDLESYKSQP